MMSELNMVNKAIYLCIKELDMRLSNNQIYTKDRAKKYKINRMFETIAIIFYDLSFAYEGNRMYLDVETCLNNAKWYSDYFLSHKNDVYI